MRGPPPTTPAVVPTAVATALPTVEVILPNSRYLSYRIGKVGVVENVEEIGAELQADAFGEREILSAGKNRNSPGEARSIGRVLKCQPAP